MSGRSTCYDCAGVIVLESDKDPTSRRLALGEQIANACHPSAMTLVAGLFCRRARVSRDEKQALACFRKRADKEMPLRCACSASDMKSLAMARCRPGHARAWMERLSSAGNTKSDERSRQPVARACRAVLTMMKNAARFFRRPPLTMAIPQGIVQLCASARNGRGVEKRR